MVRLFFLLLLVFTYMVQYKKGKYGFFLLNKCLEQIDSIAKQNFGISFLKNLISKKNSLNNSSLNSLFEEIKVKTSYYAGFFNKGCLK